MHACISRELQEVMHPCMDTKYDTTTVYTGRHL